MGLIQLLQLPRFYVGSHTTQPWNVLTLCKRWLWLWLWLATVMVQTQLCSSNVLVEIKRQRWSGLNTTYH